MSGVEFGVPHVDELLNELVVLAGDGHGERRYAESVCRVESLEPVDTRDVLARDQSVHELVRAPLDAQLEGRVSGGLRTGEEKADAAVVLDEALETRRVALVAVGAHVCDRLALLVGDARLLVHQERHHRLIAEHCGQ